MKLRKITTKIILGITLFFLSTISAHAGFGISPTDIYHDFLTPGATFEKEFNLSRTGSLEELDIYIEPDLGNIDSWFTFEPGETFKFGLGQRTTTFKVIVNVPEDADFDEYNGIVRVKAVPANQDVKGVSITQGVRVDAGLVVTEVTVRKLSILSVDALDAVQGNPIKIEIVGENQGNVAVSPTIKAKILNLQMEELEEHELTDFGSIEPNKTSTLTADITSDLPIGEYFVEIQVLLDGEVLREERLVVNILDPVQQVSEEDEKIPLISGIMDWIRENRTFIIFISFAILVALLIEMIAYIINGKLWEKEKFRKHQEKPWALLLGSKKYTRAALSFGVGFIIFLALVLYPAVTVDHTPGIESEIAMGETQGVEDYDFSLTVFPSIEVPRYVVYQEANTESEVVYKAMEDEKFDVLEETEDWYQVSLENGEEGWLEKRFVKAESQQ